MKNACFFAFFAYAMDNVRRQTMDIFGNGRIIAAVRSRSEFEKAFSEKPENIFLLAGTILELPYLAMAAKEHGKRLFLHMDMIDGLGKDSAAVEFVAKLGFFGIISTRGNIIKQAKGLGLCTVQRFFIVDGQSMKTALDTVRQTKPSYAELMPGLVYKAIEEFAAEQIPIIAGGLINSKAEIELAMRSGAVAVSTSESTLWNI